MPFQVPCHRIDWVKVFTSSSARHKTSFWRCSSHPVSCHILKKLNLTRQKRTTQELETVSIDEPLQNRQHANCNFDQLLTFWGVGLVMLPYWSRTNLTWDSTHMVYADMPDFISVCSLCWIRWPKTTFLGKFWHLGDSCANPLIWCARADPRCKHLHDKFHLNVYIVSASGGEKPILGKFLYRPPFTNDGQIWVC